MLKHDEWELTQDARSLCEVIAPRSHTAGTTQRRCWDLEGFTWKDLEERVRVVRSEETTPIKRQVTGEVEEKESTWFWVTTLHKAQAQTRVVVDFGHRRWAIENQGFNEAVNLWHFDHVYHHEPRAMEVMVLLGMLAYNLLRFFYDRNLKPAVRDRATRLHLPTNHRRPLRRGGGLPGSSLSPKTPRQARPGPPRRLGPPAAQEA